MATNTYKAQLNYYDHTYGWGNAGTCSQGNGTAYGAGSARTGVLYFPGLASLKNKIINKVTITTTNTASGQNASKTAHFYRSASQGGIKTSLGANHRTGSQIGTLTGNFHAYANASLTFTPAFFSTYIAAGEDTYCIYSNAAADYLVWSAVSLEVNWSEPATQPSLNKSSVEMGTAVTISTPATNSAYTHTLRYAFGSASGTIATGVASAQSWTPPVPLAVQIPSAASGSGTIYCDTYSGSTLLGTKSVSITLTVPASVKPTAGTLSTSVADDTSGTGLYVKGMGKARLTLSGAAGAQGSTIKSTSISGGGWSASASTLTTGVLTAAGSVTFTATVTDSRGRTASATASITVVDYAKPGITSCLVYRCDSTGNKQNDGTYAAVEIKGTYSAISGNTLTLKAAYKPASASSYGTAVTLTNNGKTVIGGGALSASSTYDVQITAADKYNTVVQVYTLSTKSVLLSLKKNLGAAIGKVAELTGWLDIGWSTRIRQNLQVDGSVTWPNQYRITYQTIPNGADLNDVTYRLPGFYHSSLNNSAISNLPSGCNGAFELIVTSIIDYGTYCTQRVKDYRNNREWIRSQTTWKEPWTWTDWTAILSIDSSNRLLQGSMRTYNTSGESNVGSIYNTSGDMLYLYGDTSSGLRGLYDTNAGSVIRFSGNTPQIYGSWVGNAIPVSKGGTGATTVQGARTNLGMSGTPMYALWSGTHNLTSQLTVSGICANPGYNTLIFIFQEGSYNFRQQVVIPVSYLGTSKSVIFGVNDSGTGSNKRFYAWKSGNDLILEGYNYTGSGGSLRNIYGRY